MNKRALAINLFLFLTIATSLFFIKQFMDNSTQEKAQNSSLTPDAYMINASYLRTNAQGEREIIINSPKVIHYPQKDTSQFRNPQIEVYKNGEKWIISAQRATGVEGATTFYLFDDVKVRQMGIEKTLKTTLFTQTLTVFPKQNKVATQDFVRILQPGLSMCAIGLLGDLNTGTLKLLSKIKGEYDSKYTH